MDQKVPDLMNRVADFIDREKLFPKHTHLLLAVSGGLDSVVLCEVMYRLGYGFDIAHVNFQLRGDESMRDEAFVRSLAVRYKALIHIKHADTKAFAAERKLSIQEAARDIRYQWFEVLSDQGSGVKWPIVTAHHLDDNIETVLMNFFKGTGIAGLRGMLPCTGNIMRPLLFAQRSELEAFARDEGLEWVEDSSNQEIKYSRNFVRREIIPLIRQHYPSVSENIRHQTERFRNLELWMQDQLQQSLHKLVEKKGHEHFIPVEKLRKIPGVHTLMHALITPYGFSAAQLPDVMHLLDAESGKQVSAQQFRIIRNRGWLIITPIRAEESTCIVVEQLPATVQLAEGMLQISLVPHAVNIRYDEDNLTQHLDFRSIDLPLMVRRWKQGDYFYPLGMRKKKKLARFFIDQKMSLTEKDRQWVVESGSRIVSVIGQRIDDRSKINSSTKEVLRIQFKPHDQ